MLDVPPLGRRLVEVVALAAAHRPSIDVDPFPSEVAACTPDPVHDLGRVGREQHEIASRNFISSSNQSNARIAILPERLF